MKYYIDIYEMHRWNNSEEIQKKNRTCLKRKKFIAFYSNILFWIWGKYMPWLTEMTQIRKINNLLYFKGKLESNYVKLNKVKMLDFDNDFNIIIFNIIILIIK